MGGWIDTSFVVPWSFQTNSIFETIHQNGLMFHMNVSWHDLTTICSCCGNVWYSLFLIIVFVIFGQNAIFDFFKIVCPSATIFYMDAFRDDPTHAVYFIM